LWRFPGTDDTEQDISPKVGKKNLKNKFSKNFSKIFLSWLEE